MDSPRIAVAMLDCGRRARYRVARRPVDGLPRWLQWLSGALSRA